MRASGLAMIALVIGLSGCSSEESGDPAAPGGVASGAASSAAPLTAVANLQTLDGKPAGTATATPNHGTMTLLLSLRAEGLPPGEHGVHVHMTGKCEGPKFESAGGHWNPAGKAHGIDNPKGQHAGDMPNLTVGADGRGMVSYELKGATLEALIDADGAALVVHAKADDQKTDPSGNSGDRIACGVFTPA